MGRDVHSPIVQGCETNTASAMFCTPVTWGTTIVPVFVPFLGHQYTNHVLQLPGFCVERKKTYTLQSIPFGSPCPQWHTKTFVTTREKTFTAERVPTFDAALVAAVLLPPTNLRIETILLKTLVPSSSSPSTFTHDLLVTTPVSTPMSSTHSSAWIIVVMGKGRREHFATTPRLSLAVP